LNWNAACWVPPPAVMVRVVDDHVQRVFTADAPNRVWLTDITEHPTSAGRLDCCAVRDVCGNRIVGYSITDRMTARLAVDA
jgi:putative transposase